MGNGIQGLGDILISFNGQVVGKAQSISYSTISREGEVREVKMTEGTVSFGEPYKERKENIECLDLLNQEEF